MKEIIEKLAVIRCLIAPNMNEEHRQIAYNEIDNLIVKLSSQLEPLVGLQTAEVEKLPLWTEIYVQPLDIDKPEESKVYWLKHPQIEPATFYDKDFNKLVNEFIDYWGKR